MWKILKTIEDSPLFAITTHLMDPCKIKIEDRNGECVLHCSKHDCTWRPDDSDQLLLICPRAHEGP